MGAYIVKRWKITKERVRIPREDDTGWSGFRWSVYYGTRRVGRYTTWAAACRHIQVAHDSFRHLD